MSKNRFAGLQAVKKIQSNKAQQNKAEKGTSKLPERKSAKVNSAGNGKSSQTVTKRGRPRGKRSNDDFQQVTAYVRRVTYRKVSINLLDQENKGEFSELVEDLLQKWLKDQASK